MPSRTPTAGPAPRSAFPCEPRTIAKVLHPAGHKALAPAIGRDLPNHAGGLFGARGSGQLRLGGRIRLRGDRERGKQGHDGTQPVRAVSVSETSSAGPCRFPNQAHRSCECERGSVGAGLLEMPEIGSRAGAPGGVLPANARTKFMQDAAHKAQGPRPLHAHPAAPEQGLPCIQAPPCPWMLGTVNFEDETWLQRTPPVPCSLPCAGPSLDKPRLAALPGPARQGSRPGSRPPSTPQPGLP